MKLWAAFSVFFFRQSEISWDFLSYVSEFANELSISISIFHLYLWFCPFSLIVHWLTSWKDSFLKDCIASSLPWVQTKNYPNGICQPFSENSLSFALAKIWECFPDLWRYHFCLSISDKLGQIRTRFLFVRRFSMSRVILCLVEFGQVGDRSKSPIILLDTLRRHH
jgi:hypothetical protein